MARIFPLILGEPKQKTFTANATWPAPAGVTLLTTATGKGAAGAPAYNDSGYYIYKYRYYAYRHSDNTYTYSSETLMTVTATTSGGAVPAGYCEEPGQSWAQIGTDIEWRFTCYRHEKKLSGGYHPATTGASTTGFNKTFPGGVGGPATPVTFENIPVVPLQGYSIVVPAGGSLTIYWTE